MHNVNWQDNNLKHYMKITDISLQSHDKNRVNVSVDGKYDFSLDISQVVDLGIKPGQILSSEKLADLKQESEFGKLYARTLEYALIRPHSAREIGDYLYRKTLTRQYKNRKTGKISDKPGVAKTVTDRVFAKLQERGYIDDRKFASWWVENRCQSKGVSMRKLRSELAAKGVSSAIIEDVIAKSLRNDNDELAKTIAKKRRRYPDEQNLCSIWHARALTLTILKLLCATVLNRCLNSAGLVLACGTD